MFRKGESEPVAFHTVDEEMCKHFDVPCDPVKYCAGWYDAIGFRVAYGKTIVDMREEFQGYVCEIENDAANSQRNYYRTLLLILDWIEERFTFDAWAEIGRN